MTTRFARTLFLPLILSLALPAFAAEMQEVFALLAKAICTPGKPEKLKRYEGLQDRLAIVIARYGAYVPRPATRV